LRIANWYNWREDYHLKYAVAHLSPTIGGFEEDMSVPYKNWLEVGKETLIVFDETGEQMKQRLKTQVSEPLYTRGYRLVKMFD